MRLKRENCTFLHPSVLYLGHIISAESLHTDSTNVQAIFKAPDQQNVAKLRLIPWDGKLLQLFFTRPDYNPCTTVQSTPDVYLYVKKFPEPQNLLILLRVV